ncbi:hypothetical protein F7Q91_03285 [Vibrio chagasii]|uniref:TIR domain-containing protein n=1 Tax=Vibrio chagasii TaxID=170679 RepID=A0A7V7TI08_9VIBR|nr:hypothetical protein [Vibrio chagasii]KAB0482445.1 hypothetical protein F7Q91_03285 [Vibrio chagasii]
MFKGYDITTNNTVAVDLVERFCHSGIHLGQSLNSFVKDSELQIHAELDDFYFKEGILDGDLLQKSWFPFIEKSHIFLSHSHKDKVIAEQFAYICNTMLDVNVFIDSQVWGYADDLLRKIDNKFCYQSDTGTYSYEARNKTTSNIYLMLQNSLNCMIDRSECLLFLNTQNTLEDFNTNGEIDQRTSSPWVMSELQFSSLVRRREHPLANRAKDLTESQFNKSINASDSNTFEVSYKVSTDHLKKHNYNVIYNWLYHCVEQDLKGFDALTALYQESFTDNLQRLQVTQ